MKEQSCIQEFTKGIDKRIISRKYSLGELFSLAGRLSRKNNYDFKQGEFIAGPLHLLVFSPQGLRTIVTYEYLRIHFGIPVPPLMDFTSQYLRLKGSVENFVGRNNFHKFTTATSSILRQRF